MSGFDFRYSFIYYAAILPMASRESDIFDEMFLRTSIWGLEK
jgi:hypothetical protein